MVGVPPDASYEELTAQVEKLKKKYEGNIKKIKRIEASGAPPPRGCRGGYQPDPSRARADDAPPPSPQVAKDRIVELRLRQRAQGTIGVNAGAAMRDAEDADESAISDAVRKVSSRVGGGLLLSCVWVAERSPPHSGSRPRPSRACFGGCRTSR